MIRNFLTLAFRNLTKKPLFTTINILGLSIGIASCLLLVLYVVYEFSYDRRHPDGDRIYKMALERKYPNHATFYAVVPHSFAEVMPKDFPEIETILKVAGPNNQVIVSYDNEKGDLVTFEENNILFADSNFFTLFNFPLVKGDPKTAIRQNDDIVVTESTAIKYFGSEDPIGKTLTWFGQNFKVTGVAYDVPDNSHLKFSMVGKWNDQLFGNRSNFITFSAHVYLKLIPGADPKSLEEKFPAMVDAYASSQIETDLGKSWEEYKKEGNGYRYFLQPLRAIHLDPTNIEAKFEAGGNINYLYFLSGVAALILIIACINFMNLSTARSAERAREVGVRKAMGSQKAQLVTQFLTESVALSLVALSLALVMVYLALPYFNGLMQKPLHFPLELTTLGSVVGATLVVGLLAGIYPAFFISAFNPVTVMKGNLSSQSGGSWLRNGLVVFQFLVSTVLIIATLVVSNQIEYMELKSLGYNKERIMIVERTFGLNERAQTFIEELRRLPEVQQTAGSSAVLGRQTDYFGAQYQAEGSSEILTTKGMVIGDLFAETVGFELLAGRNFSQVTDDSLSIILNEAALKVLEINDPIGKKLYQVQRTPQGVVNVPYTIIGVVRDFNFQSLRDPVTPLTIHSTEAFENGVGYVYLRLKEGSMENVVAQAEAKWKEFMPQDPFRFTFLEESLHANYSSETRTGNLFRVFTMLAIVIACVGLFGLAAYATSLRTKEIGVRKVLGASVLSVILLLSKDFTRLIVMAFVVAVPVAYFVMDNWLDGFAYRIALGADVFVIAGLIVVAIAWITVSFQTLRAAVMNPTRSLRTE